MKKTATTCLLAAILLVGATSAVGSERDLSCALEFSSKEWSALYASVVGEGTVTCKDGMSIPVAIRANGVGITAGKWKITDGTGKFTDVARIDDVLGHYLALSGDVGVVKAGTARVLSKGKVSLVLTGKGEGFDIGIAISDFRISRRNPRPSEKGDI
ncbi:hypothetical protein [Pseudoxanthomonas sp. SE1]|uniref:hypothetical protein n=1 Tax=Pseudoxanthomonas sp. SE1 TaxID=1664560 RepID=UPI00240E0BE8|nr:hypothetical protein [Pseudoxanthomonas sp. SE1]WFC41547.1 hypothetical protein OY559_17450 [Pseudoxanthomonas sp. SE1]